MRCNIHVREAKFLIPKKIKMYNMNFQIEDPNHRSTSTEDPQEIINPNPDEVNISDGGEFLDDEIRMKEQPFEGTPGKEQETKFPTNKNNYYEMY
jgi:hypothetical protein